jgi:hypothetical protein
LVAAVLGWSGVTLADDPTALARVDVQPFGETLERVARVRARRTEDSPGGARPAPDATDATDTRRAAVGGRRGSPAGLAGLGTRRQAEAQQRRAREGDVRAVLFDDQGQPLRLVSIIVAPPRPLSQRRSYWPPSKVAA